MDLCYSHSVQQKRVVQGMACSTRQDSWAELAAQHSTGMLGAGPSRRASQGREHVVIRPQHVSSSVRPMATKHLCGVVGWAVTLPSAPSLLPSFHPRLCTATAAASTPPRSLVLPVAVFDCQQFLERRSRPSTATRRFRSTTALRELLPRTTLDPSKTIHRVIASPRMRRPEVGPRLRPHPMDPSRQTATSSCHDTR